jgi:hypothetical protein
LGLVIANTTNFPLRSATGPDLALIRIFLRESGFDVVTLCRGLGMENMSGLGRVDWDKVDSTAMSAAGHWCVQVFARGRPTETGAAREVCGEPVLQALLRAGLLRPALKIPGALVCPVWLYPLAGFVIASDRVDDPDGEPFTPPTDVVFPAIYAGTLRFLALLPPVHGGEALDLCGGSGIGALILSATARTAASADLAERSALFAGFNARLNDVPMESFCGDLYEPVADRQFDVITAHPPFVPATGHNMVYRDGGDTGEEVIRGVVAGLPAHLRAGGVCVILCVARDTEQHTFEQRVQEWLGPEPDGFDVVFGLDKVLTVPEVVESIHQRGSHLGEAGARQLALRLQSLGTRQFVYGALFIRRDAGRGVRPPARIRITPLAGAADFERLLNWRRLARQAGFPAWLANARPRLAPQLLLTARHVVREGSLVPADFTFEIETGVRAALRPDAWVVPLLARLEGGANVAEVFASAQTGDELPAGFKLEDFLDLVRIMIERRFLEVDCPDNIN